MIAILLAEAIDSYLVSISHRESKTPNEYRRTLREILRAFPDSRLHEFEPPEGTVRARVVLDRAFGLRADRTYNRAVSVFRSFFAWATESGHLQESPGEGLERRHAESKSRTPFTDEECAKILALNTDPRDAVPLRLLFLAGSESATLRQLRFGDFDPAKRVVTFTIRGNRRHPLPLDDPDLWRDYETLRRLRAAADDDMLLPRTKPRLAQKKPGQRPQGQDDPMRYLRQRLDGRWEVVTIVDTKLSTTHKGVFNWWYRCLCQAGISEPGVTKDIPMSRARITASRRAQLEGGPREVRRVLGISRSGTSADVHENRDADRLDSALRHLHHELRPVSKSVQWWKAPMLALLVYLKKERDLLELSRVSIGMLSQEPADSAAVRAAAETLIRAVPSATLIKRARNEAMGDHSLLHGHSLVAICSAMETMSADVAAAWLQVQGASIIPPRPRRRTRDRPRVEQLLDPAGLSGRIDPVLAQNLDEMQQLRHVFAHKRGRADATFIKSCPDFGYRVGQQVVIDRDAWADMMISAVLYAETVLRRMKQQLDIPMAGRPLPPTPLRYRGTG
jgi:site-specific recombinase XerC